MNNDFIQQDQTPRVSLEDVTKVYSGERGSVVALDGITFDVAPGEFVSIVGASGCGKTTLLRIVDGLVDLTAGRSFIDGLSVEEAADKRAFVFQSDALLPWRSIIDNIAFGLELRRVGREERRNRAQEYVELVGLAGFEDHYPHELSGGMRQRANLARALTVDPDVLLLDEPFAALDAQTREVMQRELLRIRGATKKTVLFITHQIDEAVFLSDRIIVLTARPGRVREIVDIPIPRPRDRRSRQHPAFQSTVEHIWGLIEKEVEMAMQA